MRIAVASGKGGTGKTTISVSLALACSSMLPTQYIDCDVEEPNGHLSMEPLIGSSEAVSVLVPKVNSSICDGCGVCGDVCQYGAIAPLGGKAMVFQELCHGCGGCARFCPHGALSEVDRPIGVVEAGKSGETTFLQGRMDIGVAMSPPVIRAVRDRADRMAQEQSEKGFQMLQVIDSPPGTSCPMVTAVKGCDYVIMVTEPTPFGLHDMDLAVDTVREMGIPLGVIINKCDMGDGKTLAYCREKGISVLLEIPQSRHIASVCSAGGTLLRAVPAMKSQMTGLLEKIRLEARVNE